MIDDSPPLPKGWRWSPLADACPQRARNVDPCQFNEEFDYVDISAVDLNLKEITGARRLRPEQAPSRARQLIEAGDILVSGTRPNLNAVALVPSHLHHSICSTGFSVLRPGSEVDGNFLFSWVQTQRFVQSLTSLIQGALYPAVTEAIVRKQRFPVPPILEQRRIVAALNEHRAVLTAARVKADECAGDVGRLLNVELAEALGAASRIYTLGECLTEIKVGVGQEWARYPVLGATREGVAPAKEPVGKTPERYKLARAGTIFYNPMRILIGSIALVDDDTTEGIVSPDYVVAKPKLDKILPRFLYYWLRSRYGASAILDSARGAVRERMMFQGLAKIELPLPDIERQFRFDRAYNASQTARLRLNAQEQELAALQSALLRAAFSGAL